MIKIFSFEVIKFNNINNKAEGNFLHFIWYLTLTSAIWISFFGSIKVFSQQIYPYQILIILLYFIIILNGKIEFSQFEIITIMFWYLFFLRGFISLYWIENQYLGMVKLSHYFFGILLLLGFIIVIKDKEILSKSINVFFYNYLLIIILAIYEMVTGYHFRATHPIQTVHKSSYGYHYPLVQFNNTNDLAVFLYMFYPLIAYKLNKINKYGRLLNVTFYILVYSIILNTGSRMVSLLMLVYPIIRITRFLYNLEYGKRAFNILLLILLPVLGLYLAINNYEPLYNILYPVFTDARIGIYKNTIEELLNNNLIGVGIGGLPEIIFGNIGAVHNYLLEVLTEFGVYIFVLLLLWYSKMVINLYKASILASFTEKNLFNDFVMQVFTLFLWGGVSSIMTRIPHMWIFYGFLFTMPLLSIDNRDINYRQ